MNRRIDAYSTAHLCPEAVALCEVQLEVKFKVGLNFQTCIRNEDTNGRTVFVTLREDIDTFLLDINHVPCLLPRYQAWHLEHGVNHLIIFTFSKVVVKLVRIVCVLFINNEGVNLTFFIHKLLKVFRVVNKLIIVGHVTRARSKADRAVRNIAIQLCSKATVERLEEVGNATFVRRNNVSRSRALYGINHTDVRRTINVFPNVKGIPLTEFRNLKVVEQTFVDFNANGVGIKALYIGFATEVVVKLERKSTRIFFVVKRHLFSNRN